MGDDAYRTQYTSSEPTVKILKRPTQNSNGGGDGPFMNGENKPSRQPIKTLQQVGYFLPFFSWTNIGLLLIIYVSL